MWGFITVLVDALIPRLKDVFELTYLQAGLVQFAWFTAYGLISIPGGRMIKRMGYKNGIMAGLSLAAMGCLIFYPAASTRLFPFVLAGPCLWSPQASPFCKLPPIPTSQCWGQKRGLRAD